MKPTSTFNLSKTTKRMMAQIVDRDLRIGFKHAMINAQLASEAAAKANARGKSKDE